MQCRLKREQHAHNGIQTVTSRRQDSRGRRFLQRLVVHGGVRYRPSWIVEVHALLSGSEPLRVGLRGCCSHLLRDLARLSPRQQSSSMSRENSLSGRVALVMGVSRRRGVGFALARELSHLGADLFLHSFAAYDAAQPWGADPGGAMSLVSELWQSGQRVEHVDTDLEPPNAPESLVRSATTAFGHIDILIVNHAHAAPGCLEEVTADQIDRHLHVNVRASLLLAKAFAAARRVRCATHVWTACCANARRTSVRS